MIRQKQLEGQAGSGGPPQNQQIDASAQQQFANSATAFGNTDKRVQDNMKEFYKARDAIYSETGRN